MPSPPHPQPRQHHGQGNRKCATYYRTKLGDYEITVVSDGARPIPLPPRFVVNVPNEEVLKAAEAAYMPKGTVFAPFNPVVVNTGSEADPDRHRLRSQASARRSGCCRGRWPPPSFDPKTIDIVLISHLHGDHINGIKNPDGSLAFPNAEIMVPAIDWTYWMDDANMAKAPDGFFKASFGFNRKIFGNLKDRVTRYDWGKEVAPGITAVETAGHTPGHTSFVIASGSSKLFYQADVTNVPDLFLRNPDWQVMFDGLSRSARSACPA